MGSSNSVQKRKSAFILPKEMGKRSIISLGPNDDVSNSSIGASAIRAVDIALDVNQGKTVKIDGSSNKIVMV